MDEYMDRLLHQDIVFQIALPRLPKRAHLEVAGYLDHARQSIMGDAEAAEQYLRELAQKGCEPAQVALEERSKRLAAMSRKYDRSSTKLQLILTPAVEERESNIKSSADDRPRRERSRSRSPDRDLGANSVIRTRKKHTEDMPIMPTDETRTTEAVTATREREPKYGSLFKKEKSYRKDSSSSAKRKSSSSSSNKKKRNKECDAAESTSNATPTNAKLEEGSEEYWNAQRAKLGLKQLK
jgi:hypothetical protein